MVTKTIKKVNYWIKQYFNPKEYPNNSWYRQNIERNYDYVILGNGKLKQEDFVVQGKKFFDWQLSGQTLLWDFKVLKQYFSILKPNGIVFFSVDKNSLIYGNSEVVDIRPYYNVISTYALSHNKWNIIMIKIQKKIPILMFRYKDLFNKYRNSNNHLKTCKCVLPLIEEIKIFCKERNIHPVFVSNEDESYIDAKGLDVVIIKRQDLINFILDN